MTDVHVVVPDTVRDPSRPSGGNVYDREVCRGLAVAGWTVHEHAVPGSWPTPEAAALHRLAAILDALPEDALVLVDGLVGSAAAEVLVPRAHRSRLVVLVHMPLGEASPDARGGEAAVLRAAASVVTTSRWTRDLLHELYQLPSDRVHVAEPGVEPADPATGSESGGELLCVGAVTPGKGYDVLIEALAAIRELPWRCTCVGALHVDPAFADRTHEQARLRGIGTRVRFTGPLARSELAARYARADLLVLPSRAETYGMVVTEALARAVPVLATTVGGVPDAMCGTPPGSTPGMLVPPGDPAPLTAALRSWLGDPQLRLRLRQAARARRRTVTGWSQTSAQLAEALAGAAR